MPDINGMANDNDKRNRAQNGQYQAAFERMCKCGHTNGCHDGERAKGSDGKMYQFCQEDDCDCECYSKARATRKGWGMDELVAVAVFGWKLLCAGFGIGCVYQLVQIARGK